MDVALIWDPALATYRFPEAHPMRPERFTMAVALMRENGLLGEIPGVLPAETQGARACVLRPEQASDEDLLLVHAPEYVAHVRAVSRDPSQADMRFGIGAGDTPAFEGMHEAAALAVGGTILALETVLDGRAIRAFSPAGGMHHAQRDRASGFCIYNDCAVAISRATLRRPGLRVAYVDIDAHHGDGVEAAFWDRSDVFTASIHESGRFIFPGTGSDRDIGEDEGLGFALNVPLLPGAGDAELLAALDEKVVPALTEFGPDVIVAQLGADSHAGDPLAHLDVSVDGFLDAVGRIRAAADELCEGRLAAVGGGGYQPYDVVPRMWAGALAVLLGVPTS
jgi:acetoin utilization protein AcuC